MSQMNPFGGFQVDAGVQIPTHSTYTEYGDQTAGEGNAAILDPAPAPSANSGYDQSGQHVYAADVEVATPAPEIVGNQGNVAQVQTDNDPANVSGPSPAQPEIGLPDVYGGLQALDQKIDNLIDSLSPYVQAKPDGDYLDT